MIVDCDIETFSATDLKRTGVYRYTEDPTFMVLMSGWSVSDGEVWVDEDEHSLIKTFVDLWDEGATFAAHNAQFERICFSRAVGLPTGQYLDPRRFIDTRALVAEAGYPQALAKAAVRLGADEEKDSAGGALVRFFCLPNRQGKRNRPQDHPEKWAQFVNYCAQDVRTMADIRNRVVSWPTRAEQNTYVVDQLINDRGMRVDVDLADCAARAVRANSVVQLGQLAKITGLANPNSVPQLSGWFRGTGLPLPNLAAATIEKALKKPDLSPTHKEALELRQDMAGTASKKHAVALERVSDDGRIRGGFRFYGAHTGRWTGSGLQPHNFPRQQFVDADGEFDEAAQDAAILDLLLGLGADAFALKAIVRALLLGPLTVVDYASIEARVLAWMAGEEWALQAFRDGRDIYVETAQRMGVPTRAQGKVAVLALGYNGGVNSLRAMGAKGTDDQLQAMVYQWRNANPRIWRYWKLLDAKFRTGGSVGDHVSVEKDGNDRLIRLPSGRAIVYRDCTFGDRITFFSPQNGGMRLDTYGGRLTENVTQGIARDVMAAALVSLEREGYPVIAHVHDEIIVEGEHSVSTVSEVMTRVPSWATGLPIDGEGFTCRRYRKG